MKVFEGVFVWFSFSFRPPSGRASVRGLALAFASLPCHGGGSEAGSSELDGEDYSLNGRDCGPAPLRRARAGPRVSAE